MKKQTINTIVNTALKEDCARADITSRSMISSTHRSVAKIVAHENAVVSGTSVAVTVFKQLDKNIRIKIHVIDGRAVKKGKTIMTIKGTTRTILAGERTALNFLGHLSGIATQTRSYVSKTKGTRAKVSDTRKTTPGLRDLEKYAVTCGGGTNHRHNLSTMVMVKDNHLAASNISLSKVVKKIRKKTVKKIQIEVDTLKQLKEVLPTKPDYILLDNMSIKTLKKGVALAKITPKRPLLEASGRVTLKSIRQIAKTGVDRISIGALTHSVKCIDFSMEITP